MHIQELDTPALLVDRSRLERNIRAMMDLAVQNGKKLRPHIKTHKCVEIMKLQVAAGANGITAAKVSEAEVMVNGGAQDVFIANQVIGDFKAERLAQLARRAVISAAVDTRFGVTFAARAARKMNVSLALMIEVDTGLGRAGVRSVDEAVSLARAIIDEPGVTVGGVFTHEGHLYRAMNDGQRERAAAAVAETIRRAGDAVAAEVGRAVTVSVGSTPGANLMALQAGITEMRPGVYVLGDRMQCSLGRAESDCALSVLSTVTSVTSDGKFVIDAGIKTLASDRPFEDGTYGSILGNKQWQFIQASEEHGVVMHHGDSVPAPGDRIRIVPNHACTCVNMHNFIYLVDGERVLERWSVDARGCIN